MEIIVGFSLSGLIFILYWCYAYPRDLSNALRFEWGGGHHGLAVSIGVWLMLAATFSGLIVMVISA